MAQNFSSESASEALPQLQVIVHAGPLAGKGYLFNGETITFGRDPENDIFWEDSRVSRFHAKILRQRDRLILEDLGSTNGTLVNGKPIEGPHILQPADIISVGSSVFGVKGFAAPQTVGITQISMRSLESADQRPSPPSPPTKRPARPAPRKPAAPAARKSSGPSLLSVLGILLVILIILGMAAATAYFFFFPGQSSSGQSAGPAVVITAPISGSQVQVGQPVVVQTTASDPAGVVKLELWVSGQKFGEAVSPAQQGQATLTASMQWTPAAPGSYTLEVRSLNAQKRSGQPALVAVTAVAAATPTPSPSPTAQTPSPTVPSTPQLTTLTDLNVRAGPGTFYDPVGLLPVGAGAEILGKSDDGQWWQIKFAPATAGTGWIISDPEFSIALNAGNVPMVPAPPTPTGTPTETPTNTPIPPTGTPTPTATPTQPSSQVQFAVTPTNIQGGECVVAAWNVTGVKEVYYQDQGVAGADKRTECPTQTTTYTLRVVKLDNSEQVEKITVTVTQPVASSGSIKLNPNQTIDFDRGVTPGDDFLWRHNGDNRYFETLPGVDLSPQSITGSLDSLSLENCKNASYGNFNNLDGSDVILDPANELTDGRSACFITNEGRYGKLRFPKFSPDSITVEWLTWQ